MKVAIIGSRNCQNFSVEEMLGHIPLNCTQIISGGAPGIDQMAAQLARVIGVPLVEIRPDYAQYGKRAPLQRNGEIVARADLVVAFWDMYSRGTAHTIQECIRQRVPIQVIPLPKQAGE